ncbi:MAG: hypothetical protein IJE07_07885 [Clostridia bacterium]|nr:hypothetical protein [Clostridia bacterium]
MGILNKYFETEAGQVRPSRSIRTLARITYWVWLISGVVALVGCAIASFSIMDYNHEAGCLYLVIAALCPVVCKLMGWLSSLGLRAIAVVVESHEKNLDLQPEADHVRAAMMDMATAAAGKAKEVAGRVTAMADKAQEAHRSMSTEKKKSAPAQMQPPADGWVCPECGARNPRHLGTCPDCGTVRQRRA